MNIRSNLAVLSVCAMLSATTSAHARFLQVDPVGYQADLNLYAYVNNDPMDRTDPTGLYSCGASLSKDNCTTFTSAQNAARAQITGALGALHNLRENLSSGRLTGQDRAVQAVMNKFMGEGSGSDIGAIDRLAGAATKMLGMLNSNMPAELGSGGKGAYEYAEATQLTLYPKFFANPNSASASTQRSQTMAHASAHHGLNLIDTPLSRRNPNLDLSPYGERNAATRATIWPSETWDNPDSLTFALGFHRTDD